MPSSFEFEGKTMTDPEEIADKFCKYFTNIGPNLAGAICDVNSSSHIHIFTYDLFHMHHSLTYLSREHMNPKLTCSQRQWLHSSVGRASHRYREVTGSSPVEVLNFFQASLRNCKNCDHNCEDHSSFELIPLLVLLLVMLTILLSP